MIYVKGMPVPIEVDETVDAIKKLMSRADGGGRHGNRHLVELGEIPSYGGPARSIWLRPIDIAAVTAQ